MCVYTHFRRNQTSETFLHLDEPKTYDNYLTRLMTDIHDLQDLGRQNIISSKLKTKGYYNRKINPRCFQVDDEAFLLREPKKGTNLVINILDLTQFYIYYLVVV